MATSTATLLAAARLLDLLRRSDLATALSLVKADSSFADLTITQYHAGKDLLAELGFLRTWGGGTGLDGDARSTGPNEIRRDLLARLLVYDIPTWLPDSDQLVIGPGDLPSDALGHGKALGLSASEVVVSVRRAHLKFDGAVRALVGRQGEEALVSLLERYHPGSTAHVSTWDDTCGYDIEYRQGAEAFHLEVKSTTRRGRMVMYLSRHEFDTMLVDPSWRLVLVGVDAEGSLGAVGCVGSEMLVQRAPEDAHAAAAWASTKYEWGPPDLQRGLTFYRPDKPNVLSRGYRREGEFPWLY